jgi:hypothetical protein
MAERDGTMKTVILILASLFVFAGCIGTQTPTNEIFPVDPDMVKTGIVRRAVVAGLTQVDPDAYGGWDGNCPGCDIDAEIFARLCAENGLEVGLALNESATIENLVTAARGAWRDMSENDLFVFYISGHGGQIKDVSGDEEDAQDETLCLWDGELSDDVLRSLWEEIPAGVRVLFITDTCNSGSNYKARSFRKALPRNFTGSLIHYGGCADGESSFGSEQGGAFTTALIDAWDPSHTYQSWFNEALQFMSRNQIPVYAEYGNVSGNFRDRKVFQ